MPNLTPSTDLVQIAKVKTCQVPSNEEGDFHILYETADDEGQACYDIYEDDGHGNGAMLCRGYNRNRIISMFLLLGEFVEWKKDVPVIGGKAS